MRKFSIVTAAAVAFAAFTAIAGLAMGGSRANDSTITGQFLPDTGIGSETKGGLFIEATTLDDADTGTPTNPNGPQPDPTIQVDLDLDDNFKIGVGAVPRCTANLAGTTTQAAMQACGDAHIGGGVSTLCVNNGLGGCTDAQAVVTAFNGPSGPNRILLHGRDDAFALTVVLEGTIKNSPLAGDFGKRLTVPVPLVAGGAASITDFTVNVNNGGFIKSSCSGDNDLDYSARFDYNTQATDTATDTQACTP